MPKPGVLAGKGALRPRQDRGTERVGNGEGGDKEACRAGRDAEASGHRWQHAADDEGVRAYGERAGG